MGAWLAHARGTLEQATQAFLSVDPGLLDLGEVWEQNELRCTLPIANRTRKPIEVTEFRQSCSCTSVSPPSLAIPAGETRDVTVTVDLTPTGFADLDKPRRPFAVDIAPIADAVIPRTIVWKLHGTVRRALKTVPPVMDFGEGLIRGCPMPTQTAQIAPTTGLSGIDAFCDGAEVEVARGGADPSGFELRITPNEPASAGPVRLPVQLVAHLSDGTRLPSVRYPVVGHAVEDVAALPAVLVLGPRKVGETVVETVLLHSRSKTPFVVEQVEPSAGDVAIEPMGTREPNASTWRYRITTRSAHAGTASEKVRFAYTMRGSGAAEGRVRELVLPVSYVGIR